MCLLAANRAQVFNAFNVLIEIAQTLCLAYPLAANVTGSDLGTGCAEHLDHAHGVF